MTYYPRTITSPSPGTIPIWDHNPPPRTTKAGGMHPTGMLSCFFKFSMTNFENLKHAFSVISWI